MLYLRICEKNRIFVAENEGKTLLYFICSLSLSLIY